MTAPLIDINTFKNIPAVIVGNYSHKVSKGTIPGSSKIWFRKEMHSPDIARLEILTQEFFRLIIPNQPVTLLARNPVLNTHYILSEEVSGFRQLPHDQQKEFYNGTYYGLGQIALVSIFVQEIDLKNSNVGLNDDNRVIKIDGDWAFVSIKEPHNYEKRPRKITLELLKSLPYPEGVYTYTWLDFIVQEAVKPVPSIVDKNLAHAAHYRKETNEAILKILLLPDSYIKNFVDAYLPIGSSADRFIKFIQERREELKQVALKDQSFQTYLTSSSALDDVRKHLAHMKGFMANGLAPIINPDQFATLDKDYEKCVRDIFPSAISSQLTSSASVVYKTPNIIFLGDFHDGAHYQDVNTGVIYVEKGNTNLFKDKNGLVIIPHPKYNEMMLKEINAVKIHEAQKLRESKLVLSNIQGIVADFGNLTTLKEVETSSLNKLKLIEELSKKIENLHLKADFLKCIKLKRDEIRASADKRIHTIKNANEVIQETVSLINNFHFNFGRLNTQDQINAHYDRLLRHLSAIAQNIEVKKAHRELNLSEIHQDIKQVFDSKQHVIEQSFEILCERFEILSKINFDMHLKIFGDKLNQMSEKAEENNLYNDAIDEMTKFCDALNTAKINFLHNTGSTASAKRKLANDCQMAIGSAKPVLKEHREWKGAVVKFIMDVISFLTLGLIDGQLSLFSATRSNQMLNHFENETNIILVR